MTMRVRRRPNAKTLPFQPNKKGPGRRHLSGRVRASLSALPEFGVDRKGVPIQELPPKYMHAAARRRSGVFEVWLP